MDNGLEKMLPHSFSPQVHCHKKTKQSLNFYPTFINLLEGKLIEYLFTLKILSFITYSQ